MNELSERIVDALDELKDAEILTATNNALKIRAWLYLLRFLSSFNESYEKKNPYSSIELSPTQSSLFAFGLDDNNSENFLFFCQEADFWWMDEIGIESAYFVDKYLILKFPPIDYENLNIKSDNKISLKSLTVSIPLSEMYLDYLKGYMKGFKNIYLGRVKRSSAGFNKLEILEFSETPIPVKAQRDILSKQFYKKNHTTF